MTMTNAERQKKHRDEQRNAKAVTPVTKPVTVTESVTVSPVVTETGVTEIEGTPWLSKPVVSTPTIYPDPVHRNAVIDVLTEHVPGLRRAVNAAELGDGLEFSPAVLDSEDPIVGLSLLTARMAVTSSGRLIDTHTLTKEQMVEGGIWLGPNPDNADTKPVKAPRRK